MAPEISTTPTSTTGIETSELRAGRSPSATQASRPTRTTWALAITVARPAPTASIEWCQKREIGREEHAGAEREEVVAPPERAEAPALDPGEHAPAPAARTRSGTPPRWRARPRPAERGCAEKAITRAPSTPAMRGRSFMRPPRLARRIRSLPRVDRNSLHVDARPLLRRLGACSRSVRNLTERRELRRRSSRPRRRPGSCWSAAIVVYVKRRS